MKSVSFVFFRSIGVKALRGGWVHSRTIEVDNETELELSAHAVS